MSRRFVLKPGRELTALGGHGVARQLPRVQNTPAVFWSPKHCNSYVAVRDEGREQWGRPMSSDYIACINGIGEIRWTLELDDAAWSGDSEADLAIAYFFDEVNDEA